MKPAPFDYVRPANLDDACQLLAEAGGGAAIIAGGQTLMPLLNLRMSQPFVLIDLGGISDLQRIERRENCTRIGAMTAQADALSDPLIAIHMPLFQTALAHVGHHQTRNRGTIGGSIALGEPAAEMPATAVAYGAEIELRSVRGIRRIAASDMYIGPYLTVLEPDEIITAIDYPDWPAGSISLFRELAQRPGDFALVGLVGHILVSSGKVERASLAWFGMGPTPIKMRAAESALVGQSWADIDAHRIAEVAISDAQPFDDSHASAEYRRTVGRRIFAKALNEATQSGVAV